MPAQCGHGHADALSIELRIDGRELLVDTGTFTYGGSSDWRAYFRSTRAHNTLRIDDADQSRQLTAFQWDNPFTAELTRSEVREDGSVVLLACHDGYASSHITHWRLLLIVPGELLIIRDFVHGNGAHDIELNWHFAEPPAVVGNQLRFDGYSCPVLMNLSSEDFRLYSGKIDPILGWRSGLYGT
jgi:uncharacterized heparinase superfamily protein